MATRRQNVLRSGQDVLTWRVRPWQRDASRRRLGARPAWSAEIVVEGSPWNCEVARGAVPLGLGLPAVGSVLAARRRREDEAATA